MYMHLKLLKTIIIYYFKCFHDHSMCIVFTKNGKTI